eukprot:m.1347572 g.1347572  ORF g.1347572 m.1347572 type:complete len:71 (+) comp24912_c0_seq10:2792-3004(+)
MQRHHTHDDDEAASLRMMLEDMEAQAPGPSRSAEDDVFGDETDHSSDEDAGQPPQQDALRENTLIEHNML